MPTGRLMLDIGKFFLGTPYAGGTLETKGTERLIVNLRKYDCFTFVENVVALATLCKFRERSFEAFCRVLQKIRYRKGRLAGYSSRLHYFSDWIYDNQKKGVLKDVTREIGGKPLAKPLNLMTSRPDIYPRLQHPGNLRDMKSVERKINRRLHFSIPKKALRPVEERIYDGDLIGITSNTEGLDVQHVGLAVKLKDRIHLLHASSKQGQVVISRETLYGYLTGSRTRSGIRVARVL